jgi:hypothetical protein
MKEMKVIKINQELNRKLQKQISPLGKANQVKIQKEKKGLK